MNKQRGFIIKIKSLNGTRPLEIKKLDPNHLLISLLLRRLDHIVEHLQEVQTPIDFQLQNSKVLNEPLANNISPIF